MNNRPDEEKPKPRLVTILVGGYLIVLYLGLFVLIGISRYEQAIAVSSPASIGITATPHILVHQPDSQTIVMYEDFSTDRQEWNLYYPYGKLEVTNGKLILQPSIQSGIVIGSSEKFFSSGDPYYVQASFTTDVDNTPPYGLIFGFDRSLDTYYIFEILPRATEFRLLKNNSGNWHELIPYSPQPLNPFPATNTLSVYFNEGNIELYINGKSISTYIDTDFFRSAGVGVFASNSGYRLIVDDFFIYAKR